MAKFVHLPLLIFTSLFVICTAHASSDLIIGSIKIAGLERTEEVTVLRELPFVIGSVWQTEFSEYAERRLRNLGIFSEATVRPPDEKGEVHIQLKERWSLWVLPQGARADNGASSASVVLDEYNLLGLNHHARLAYKREI